MVVEEAEAEKWTDDAWFIDGLPLEDKTPMIPLSTGHTAALFCIEALGVPLPPETGWVPRENQSSRSGSKSASSKDKEEKAEWYRNVKTAEWIFHATESVYYHLPTSSLWERRALECVDSSVVSHTYFRIDSNVLEALSRFAMSLDVGLVPMTFKAWVRYMRKKKDKHFGIPAPPASPGKENGGSTEQVPESKPPAERQESSSNLRGSEVALPPSAEATAGMASLSCAPAVFMDASKAITAMRKSRSKIFDMIDDEQELQEPRTMAGYKSKTGTPGLEDILELGQSFITDNSSVPPEKGMPVDQDSSADEGFLAKDGSRKGLFCLRCFRSSRAKPRRKADANAEATAAEEAATGPSPAPAATDAAAPEKQALAGEVKTEGSAVTEPENKEPMEAKGTVIVDSVDRHIRRLDSFLDLVTRNPQRIVDHIEKRRQGRTTSLGMFVA